MEYRLEIRREWTGSWFARIWAREEELVEPGRRVIVDPIDFVHIAIVEMDLNFEGTERGRILDEATLHLIEGAMKTHNLEALRRGLNGRQECGRERLV